MAQLGLSGRPDGRPDDEAAIPTDVAQTVVDQVMARLRRNVNIMDVDGRILASGDAGRIGSLHEAAREAVRSGRTVTVEPHEVAGLRGTQPGVNVPIVLDGRTVGAVGVTGRPRDVAEVAAAVSLTVELMLQQEASQEEWRWRDRACTQVVDDLASGRLDEAAWRHRMHLVGCDPHAPYLVLAWRLDSSPPASLLRRRLDIGGDRTFLATDADSVVWVVAGAGHHDTARQRLAATRRRLARAGVGGRLLDGGTAADLDALSDRVRRLRLVPADRSPGADGPAPDTTLDAHELPVLLATADPGLAAAARRRLLAGLDEELLTTLAVFLQCDLRVSRTAARLVVHRNTVLNRLDRITATTGRDPRVLADAATLHAALLLTQSSTGEQRRD